MANVIKENTVTLIADKPEKDDLALQVLALFQNTFPEYFTAVNHLFRTCYKEKPVLWDTSRCILPTIETVKLFLTPGIPEQLRIEPEPQSLIWLNTMYCFSKSKFIFLIDKDTKEYIFKSVDVDKDIPCDVLINLPYKAFFVDVGRDEGIAGFYVRLDDIGYLGTSEFDDANYALYLSIVNSDGSLGASTTVPLIHGTSLVDCYKKFFKKNDMFDNYLEEHVEQTMRATMHMINLVVYLCTVNADVVKVSKTMSRYKSSGKKTEDLCKKTVFSNVGYRLGPQLRRHTETVERAKREGSGHGTSKAPHIRSAHYHTYRVGSMKQDKEKRGVIVRWIPPIGVNCDWESELPAVGRKVQSAKKNKR